MSFGKQCLSRKERSSCWTFRGRTSETGHYFLPLERNSAKFTPETYPVALSLMILSILSWGSWPNTQKATRSWRFELFYWDYVWGILLCAALVGVTLGRTDPTSTESFFNNLGTSSIRSMVLAFVGGAVFNVANLLLVAAIAIAGMAVAVPIRIGLALVIGSVLNYLINPHGNPLVLFSGIFAGKVFRESLEVSGGSLHLTLPPVEPSLPSDLKPL